MDWRNRFGRSFLTTIQNQGGCECCWSFGAAALVETMVCIEHGMWSKRSEGDIRDGWGGEAGENWAVTDHIMPCQKFNGVTGALDWIVKNGVADPDCYGYVGADHLYDPTVDRVGRTTRVASYTNLGNVTDQKVWLDSVGPITCGFDVYYDFSTWNGSTPYKKSPNATYDGGHIMLLVGYDDKLQCWIARNSWGTGYGNGGYFLIAYGECNIDHYSKQGLKDVSPDPWSRRRLHNGCLIQSSDGPEHRNFELLRAGVPRVQHLWRDGGGGGVCLAPGRDADRP